MPLPEPPASAGIFNKSQCSDLFRKRFENSCNISLFWTVLKHLSLEGVIASNSSWVFCSSWPLVTTVSTKGSVQPNKNSTTSTMETIFIYSFFIFFIFRPFQPYNSCMLYKPQGHAQLAALLRGIVLSELDICWWFDFRETLYLTQSNLNSLSAAHRCLHCVVQLPVSLKGCRKAMSHHTVLHRCSLNESFFETDSLITGTGPKCFKCRSQNAFLHYIQFCLDNPFSQLCFLILLFYKTPNIIPVCHGTRKLSFTINCSTKWFILHQ